jgi:type II secretory pathway pseudopilin PulG
MIRHPTPAGHSTLEVCIALALFSISASALLGGVSLILRDATLAGMRQAAIALATEGLDRVATGVGPDSTDWQLRVASALPGGAGAQRSDASGVTVEVRWRAPVVSDTRCPGLVCVVLTGAQ